MKKALLLCASHNDLGLVFALRKLGYYIIVTGNITDQPGERFCDKYIQADYSDKELILKIARTEQIDAIIQCCNDFGVYTAAYVAEKMGLPGYDSYETTCMLHNKDRFKKLARELQLYSPLSESFNNPEAALFYLQNCQYPVIIKPTDASAGNGIVRINSLQEAPAAIKNAFDKTRAGRIVIEPFISGSQHGCCTFLINRKVVAICTNNEYSFLNPYRVEIDTFPATTFDASRDLLIRQIEQIAEHLQLTDGIFHLQYIFDGQKPQIIEVMRRILGNMYHVPGNLLSGFDWEYWETRARCGLSLEHFPAFAPPEGFFAYKTLLAPANGRITGIDITSAYQKYLYRTFMLRQAGDVITNYASEPVGFLFMMFSSQEEMQQVLIENYRNDLVRISQEDNA